MGEDAVRCFLLAMAALMLALVSYICCFVAADWRILTLKNENGASFNFGLYQECLIKSTKTICQDYGHSQDYESDKARLLSSVAIPICLILTGLAAIPATTRGCIGIKTVKHTSLYTKQCRSMTKISAILLFPSGIFGIITSAIYLKDVVSCRELLFKNERFEAIHVSSRPKLLVNKMENFGGGGRQTDFHNFSRIDRDIMSSYEVGYAPLIALTVSCLNMILSVLACFV